MNCIALWLRFVFALFLVVVAQPSFAANDDTITVPIQLRGAYLLVDITINDKPATFMIDTGSSANVVTPEAARRLGLTEGTKSAKVNGAGGAVGTVSMASIARLRMGSLLLENQSAYIIELPEVISCDGLLGTTFLRSRVVTINYEHRQLTMTAPAAFTAPKEASAFKIRLQRGTPFVEAKVNGHSGWFRVDTGAENGIALFNTFVEKNQLRSPSTPVLKIPIGRGIGGTVYGDLVRLAEFAIGSFQWEHPVTVLSQQTQGSLADTQNAGNLGGDVWKRFTVTLDYEHSKLYLAPNMLLNQPFFTPRSGLAIDRQNGVTTISYVYPNSPGTEAGIVKGDILVAVDDIPIQQLTTSELTGLLRKEVGTKIRLRILSIDKTQREVTITFRDLL